MTELKLKFKDEKDVEKLIPVTAEEFVIGRHTENDLSIADSAISRKHLKIKRFADIFIVADEGSTLGTTINGEKLTEPVALKNGDKINLGESVEIEVLLSGDNAGVSAKPTGENVEAEANIDAPNAAANTSGGGNSVSMNFFIIAPILGFAVLILGGGLFLLSRNSGKNQNTSGNDFVYSSNRYRQKNAPEDFDNRNSNEETGNSLIPANETENKDSGNSEIPSNTEISEPTPEPPVDQPKTSGDLAKIEVNSASFLRRIAQKDPRAALTGKQQEILQTKINQLKNSSALAANLKSAKNNSSQIQSLASQKNIKPQFLVAAALAKLGNSQGDVLSAAQSMASVLDDLSRNVGDEFSDDSLLAIAAYEQGAAGKTLAMRDMLQSLTDKFPESSRRIRTIWFLKDNGKISDSQFEFALRFLAAGTISQNPSDFGVNAEAVKF